MPSQKTLLPQEEPAPLGCLPVKLRTREGFPTPANSLLDGRQGGLSFIYMTLTDDLSSCSQGPWCQDLTTPGKYKYIPSQGSVFAFCSLQEHSLLEGGVSNNTELRRGRGRDTSVEIFGIRHQALIITSMCLVRVQLSSVLRSTFLACFASVTSRRLGILPN